MLELICLTALPPHLYLSFKIMYLDFNEDFGPPFGPTVGWENNFPKDTTKGVGAKTPALKLLVISLSHFF